MRRILDLTALCALATIGCRSDLGPSPVSVQRPGVSGEVNVVDFGASGHDETDDTHEIEAAMASLPPTGGTVFIPRGTYFLTAAHTNPHRALDLTGAHNVVLRGEGAPHTILRMAPGTYPGSVSTIWIENASGISISDLTIDGNRSEVSYGDEQSHTLSIVSSIGIAVDRVAFVNSGGDGIRLLGAPVAGAPWTEKVSIANSSFSDMWRNGVSIQRAVREVVIDANAFNLVSDQAISSEPSGEGGPVDIVVEDNVITHSTGNWAVALAGINSADGLKQVVFRRNRIEDGAVYFLQARDLTIESNTIIGDTRHAALRLHDVTAASVSSNLINGSSKNEGVLQVVNDGNNMSSDVTIDGNTIKVGPEMTGIYVRDASGGIRILGNTIQSANGARGIQVESVLETGLPRSDFTVEDNVIDNFKYGILFSTRGDLFSGIEIKRNEIDHDQSPPTNAVGIALGGIPVSDAIEMISNVFGTGVTSVLCMISSDVSCDRG